FFFIVWLVLSEDFDRFHMGLGLMSALAVAWFNTERTPTRPTITAIRFVLYIPWLIVQVVKSGIHLSKIILNPSLPISPQLIRFHTDIQNESGIVLLANSITLTPGTITLEVNGQEFVVHAIDAEAAKDITNSQFDQRIAAMIRQKKGQP
ncbi:MAG: Na+/H+ antiporter subunit E, partial [Pirellulaceae bacterium]